MTFTKVYAGRYRNFDKYSDVMTSAALRGVHYACAQFLVSQFQGQRYDVQEATKHKLQVPSDSFLASPQPSLLA
jgi:hypothetical protein